MSTTTSQHPDRDSVAAISGITLADWISRKDIPEVSPAGPFATTLLADGDFGEKQVRIAEHSGNPRSDNITSSLVANSVRYRAKASVVDDAHDIIATKRARNVVAQRKSRERRAQRFEELEDEVTKLQAERRHNAGCKNCKALNKECDGGRPYCMRCITAARACAGYLEYVRQSRDASWWECEICAREVDSKQWGWSCPDCDLVNPKRIQDEYLARVRALNPPPHTSRPSFEANSTREERRLDVTDPTRLTGWQVCHIVIVIGLFTFAGSLALGLGWSVARNDVSGGFTMAAYVVAVGGIPLAFQITDPLSIIGLVASSIAIVQAADRLGGLLGKLKPLLEAPREVEQLIKDVRSLKALISNVADAAKEMQCSNILPARKIGSLQGFVDEARDILGELDGLVGKFRKPGKEGKGDMQVRRLMWVRKTGEVERLTERMRDLRLSVAVELSTIHLLAAIRSNKSLDQIAIQAGQLISGHASTQRLLLQGLPDQLQMLHQPANEQTLLSFELQRDDKMPRSEASLTLPTLPPDPAKILQNLRHKLESRYKCDQWCQCSCHTPYCVDISTSWIGSLQVRVTGTPYLTPVCDSGECKTRSQPMMQIQITFPPWIMRRLLTASIFYTRSMSPTFSIQTVRVRDGCDAVFMYAQAGKTSEIQKLLATGEASVLDVTESHNSLMVFALWNKHWDLCKILLQQGADPWFENKRKQTPYLVASEIILTTKDSAVKDCLQGMFTDRSEEELHNRRMSTLQLLITNSSSVFKIQSEIDSSPHTINYQDNLGDTALLWAARCGRSDIVATLLSHGADPFITNFAGVSPLHLAIYQDHLSISLLLEAGIDPNITDHIRTCPLHYATFRSHSDPALYMRPLLAAGANINARDIAGRSVLNTACLEDSLAAVKFLIEEGADVDLPDYDGYAPINNAIWWERSAYVDVLLGAGAECDGVTASGNNILHDAARYGDLETLRVLLRWRGRLRDVDVDMRNQRGFTPVEYAEEREVIGGEWASLFEELIIGILDDQDRASSIYEDDNRIEYDNGEEQEKYAWDVDLRMRLEDESDTDTFYDALGT